MLDQMEIWFQQHGDASNSMRAFKPSMIDVRKLIEQQDINQLLVLVEFILCILLKCENSSELLQGFLQIPETSAEDMQQLIEGANIQMSEMAQSEQDAFGQSFAQTMGNQSFREDMARDLEKAENRQRYLEIRLIQMEEEAAQFEEKQKKKDAQVKKLTQQVEFYEQGFQKNNMMAEENLDGIADLEARLTFVENEKKELQQELDFMRRDNDAKERKLKDELEEMQDRYYEAR